MGRTEPQGARRASLGALVLLGAAAVSCGRVGFGLEADGGALDRPLDRAGDGSGDDRADATDGELPDGDASSCVPAGEETCGDGRDEDCDGLVDEHCPCGVRHLVLAEGGERVGQPAAAWTGAALVVAWHVEVSPTSSEIRLQAVSAAGTPLGAARQVGPPAGGAGGLRGVLAWNGAALGLVGSYVLDVGGAAAWFLVLDAVGAPAGEVVGLPAELRRGLSMAGTTSGWVVAGEDDARTSLVVLDGDGSPAPAVPLGDEVAGRAVVAAAGDLAAAGWRDGSGAVQAVRIRALGADGAPVGPTAELPVATYRAVTRGPGVAALGSDLIVAWSEAPFTAFRDIPHAVRAARVDPATGSIAWSTAALAEYATESPGTGLAIASPPAVVVRSSGPAVFWLDEVAESAEVHKTARLATLGADGSLAGEVDAVFASGGATLTQVDAVAAGEGLAVVYRGRDAAGEPTIELLLVGCVE